MHPRATYRVQLGPGFDFDAATAIVPYLQSLGISHVYCSPYLQAAPGSTHGYDVVDHSRISADLGGAAAHRRFVDALTACEMSHILDIVPNHMARVTPQNRWWWDVLENGPASRYAGYFDIEWDGDLEKSRHTVLVPILPDQYGRVLEAGGITVARDGGTFAVRCGGCELPLSPRTYDDLLSTVADAIGSAELAEVAAELGCLPHARLSDNAAVTGRHAEKELLRERLAQLCAAGPEVAVAIDVGLAALNADPDALDALLLRQNYRLAHWTTANEELDYRRFFTIDSLIGLRVEDDAVFDDTHRLVVELVQSGVITGLRIDHVDGLRDPEAYLHRLRRACGGVWTVVEKILAADEELPDWPVEGTSGYDFVTAVNNVFVDPARQPELNDCYARFHARDAVDPAPDVSYPTVVRAAKQQLMRTELAGEIERLVLGLARVCERHRRHRDHTRAQLRDALIEFMTGFSVYRTYVAPARPTSAADEAVVADALARAREARPDIDDELLEFLAELLLLEHPGAQETEFALRFAQISAPVMAKGVEDTAFYRFQRLIALNEVGGDPGVFGRPVADFHAWCAAIARRRPRTMLTLSTHDTKRSSDTRARILTLAEIPAEFSSAALRWAKHNAAHRTEPWPDPDAEYLLYQTLIGTWPISPARVREFMLKAVREAKVYTSWVRPDQDYEAALERFCAGVLADESFRDELEDFLLGNGILAAGRTVSLAAVTLLLTCPGVPDIYQGDELWSLVTVDPDNRCPVDFALREHLLQRVRGLDAAGALDHLADGGAKLWLTERLLELRRRRPEIFDSAIYVGIEAVGGKAAHVLAFTRGDLVVLVPRLVIGLADDWADTTLELPPGEWRDVLSGHSHRAGPVPVAQLLSRFPVAVLARGPG
ncbi:MAG TPA: malto-oligosyltrehalose synthase [Sporichthyaceae bacterium]|nr:malto-oligosyltrehalose synthase [Sporichthyaceae bacterium]